MSDKQTADRAADTTPPNEAPERADERVAEGDTEGSGTAAPDAGEHDPAERLADAETELEQVRRELAEAQDQLLRTRADMDNLRKRTERDLESAHKFALEKFALELLPVRDSLELGLAAAGEDGADVAKLCEGTELTLKLLTGALEKSGIVEVAPQDEKFNPDLHQAMATQPSSDLDPGHVMTVYQKGYTLNDRLLRPALVIVSAAPPEAPADGA
jgi:molecular chaperone GrpE